MTHTICSVGFFMYLCDMEPISVNYPDSSLSNLTNPCTEVLITDYGTYSFSGSTNEYVTVLYREGMGGDRNIHSIVKDTE